MANIDKVSVKNTVYNIVSPAVVSDYIEVIGGACTKPDGYEEDEVILAKQNDVQLLFKATQDIAFGANIVENTNCVRTTLEEVLKNAGGGGGASSADQVSYDNSDSGLEAENVQEAVDELATKAGTASSQIQTLTNNVSDINTALGNEVATRAKVSGHNLLPNYAVSLTNYTVEFTVNSDGSITADGTATGGNAQILWNIKKSDLSSGRYILSKTTAASGDHLYLNASNGNTFVKQLATIGGSTTESAAFDVDWDGYDKISVGYYFDQNTVVDNVTIYPMLRLATDESSDYEPYAMTNQQITPYVQAISNPNLLDNPWFTVNQRGQASYPATAFAITVDRWCRNAGEEGAPTITLGRNGVTLPLNKSDIYQKIDATIQHWEHTPYTLSAIIDGKLVSKTYLPFDDGQTHNSLVVGGDQSTGIDGITFNVIERWGTNIHLIGINTYNATQNHTITAIKWEKGEVSTLLADVEPNYATELLKCQRYFKRIVIGERIGRVNNGGLTIRFGLDETENMRSSPTATEVVDAQTGINISGVGVQFWLTKTTDYTVSANRTGGIILNLTETGAAKLASYTNQIVGIWNYNQYLDLSAEL